MNAKELANAFADAVNSSNFDCDEFVTHFARQHRTLQQSMMRAMMTCVEFAASSEYRFDGRNQGTYSLCKMIKSGWSKEVSDKLQKELGWSKEKADAESANYKLNQLGFV